MKQKITTTKTKARRKASARKAVSKKKQPTEQTTTRKPAAKKKPALKKSSRKRTTAPRPYKMPKTAAEHGITCLSESNGKVCGKPVVWFDYELGERDFYKGFVCNDHRRSSRLAKLAQPQATTATA